MLLVEMAFHRWIPYRMKIALMLMVDVRKNETFSLNANLEMHRQKKPSQGQ
jgi:hypothetical protein